MSRNKAKTKVRTAKGRKSASTRWLQRQLNDPYVEKAKKEGYRGRAAFKLVEMNEKLDFLKPDQIVVDLGAAPGGWCQVAAKYGARIAAIDLLEMDELDNVDFIQMDFMDDEAPEKLKKLLSAYSDDGLADIVMSDMAPNTTGHKQTDHLRIMAVVEAAYYFSTEVLKPNGIFIAKVFQGGAQNTLLAQMNKDFDKIRHIKPPASRKESSEQYLIATGFKG
ncbi:MAG: rRNA methyltransferase [Micavibrio sp. TMED27]|nr:rRNA methyltransferase [Micavibrio sp.]OUT92486.1 MAG: rRNA methyltransferase [Micavibrio sp. TMED27]|tara:strand:+ start:10520 stop:11182 length:663 start_codon:yes stop_codon:yes gene_type:complete